MAVSNFTNSPPVKLAETTDTPPKPFATASDRASGVAPSTQDIQANINQENSTGGTEPVLIHHAAGGHTRLGATNRWNVASNNPK